MNPPRIVSDFHKASASQGPQTDCVEVAHTDDGGRAVRDSKNPHHGTQFHSPHTWHTFTTALKTHTL
ncbi:DUF397 domain-containing protein [Streptomyces sp. NPDC005438]|uniref:DUF397 domain-containing protein n=1 Tax=Streptomyces sp. NPDC005438 TaxID=3156880 RepID=UPI0033A69E21